MRIQRVTESKKAEILTKKSTEDEAQEQQKNWNVHRIQRRISSEQKEERVFMRRGRVPGHCVGKNMHCQPCFVPGLALSITELPSAALSIPDHSAGTGAWMHLCHTEHLIPEHSLPRGPGHKTHFVVYWGCNGSHW